jgi:hypothetical protein
MVGIEAIRFTLPQLIVAVKVNHAGFCGVLLSSSFGTFYVTFYIMFIIMDSGATSRISRRTTSRR